MPVRWVAGYKASFNKLNYAGTVDHDPFSGVNPQVLLATQLHALASQHPGQISGMVPQDVAPHVVQYLQAAGLGQLP